MSQKGNRESAQKFIKRKDKEFQNKRTIKVKDIGRKGVRFFFREAWTLMPQSNLNEKVLVIERLRKEGLKGKIARRNQWKKGDIEYRIGYYIVGRIGRAKGKWVWGQLCPLIPEKDLKKLLEKARKGKTIV